MGNIEVSVLCPAYNHEKYIRKCLDGFIMQKTNFAYEVLIHDDASTDETAKIIKEYEMKYPEIIKPIYQKQNQYSKGLSIFADILLDKAKGKYLAFCEGDDYWIDENKLQLQYDALEKNKNCSICGHYVQCCNENGEEIKKHFPQDDCEIKEIVKKDSAVNNLYCTNKMYYFHTSSFFIRKEVLKLSYKLFGNAFDRNVQLAAAICGDFYYINKKMSMYRWLSNGSYTQNLKKLETSEYDNKMIHILEYDFIFDAYTNRQYHNQVMLRVYRFLIFICKRNNIKAKELFESQNGKYVSMAKSVGVLETFKFIISLYMPNCAKIIRKIKNGN